MSKHCYGVDKTPKECKYNTVRMQESILGVVMAPGAVHGDTIAGSCRKNFATPLGAVLANVLHSLPVNSLKPVNLNICTCSNYNYSDVILILFLYLVFCSDRS